MDLAINDARDDWQREYLMEMSINTTSAEASQGLLREVSSEAMGGLLRGVNSGAMGGRMGAKGLLYLKQVGREH